jgi:hypothetical protein
MRVCRMRNSKVGRFDMSGTGADRAGNASRGDHSRDQFPASSPNTVATADSADIASTAGTEHPRSTDHRPAPEGEGYLTIAQPKVRLSPRTFSSDHPPYQHRGLTSDISSQTAYGAEQASLRQSLPQFIKRTNWHDESIVNPSFFKGADHVRGEMFFSQLISCSGGETSVPAASFPLLQRGCKSARADSIQSDAFGKKTDTCAL